MQTTGSDISDQASSQSLDIPLRLHRRLLSDPWVRFAAATWVGANAWVLVAADGQLPFQWPNAASTSVLGQLLDANLALAQVFLLMVLVRALTRRRDVPDLLQRAPCRRLAAYETALLLTYGALGLLGGFALARALGWQPFGLHLAGTLHGSHQPVSPAEATTWALYNLIVYAIVPLLYFGRRYSAQELNLRSANRRNDALVIIVVLIVEAVFQLLVLTPVITELTPGQLAVGLPATFLLYLAGAVLPAMIFIYAILVPRFLRLTGSTAATVILGGLTYAGLHVWDSWAVFDSPGSTLLSLAFLLFTYFGPGMIKTYLTIRTGNAWVHVWAYHALSPHTLVDTPHTVSVLRIGP